MSKTILIKLVLCLWKIILASGKTRLFYLGQVVLHSLLFYFSYDLQQKLLLTNNCSLLYAKHYKCVWVLEPGGSQGGTNHTSQNIPTRITQHDKGGTYHNFRFRGLSQGRQKHFVFATDSEFCCSRNS